MVSKEALFIETIFSNNKNKYFNIFKNLNKKGKGKIKQILEKGTSLSLELYPNNLSIAIHSSNATWAPDEIEEIAYPR